VFQLLPPPDPKSGAYNFPRRTSSNLHKPPTFSLILYFPMEHKSPFLQKFSIQEKFTPDVWLATTDDGTEVVVKRVFNFNNEKKTKNLRNEVRAGQLLKHREGVVQFLEHFEDPIFDCSFLVFKRIEGQDLFSFMEKTRFKPLKEDEVKTLAKQLLGILEDVHSAGIAHLDIKLENIMLTPSTNKLTLIDFGLCEIVSPSGSERVSSWVGSPDYASPEILMHRPYDPFLSDVYSFGIFLFTLLFGQLPFNFDDKANNLLVFKRQPAIEWPVASEVSVEARDLITEMLESCPVERISLEKMKKHPWFTSEPSANLSITCGLETSFSNTMVVSEQESCSVAM